MLQPRADTPRRTALKYLIVALPQPARAEFRAWIAQHVSPAGACALPRPTPSTWRHVVDAAVLTVDDVDRRWIRSWTLRWVAADGGLAIPSPHVGMQGKYPEAVEFGRRQR